MKIKPCPWCGGEPKIQKMPDSSIYYEIICLNQECPLKPNSFELYISPEKAISAWNKRKEGE